MGRARRGFWFSTLAGQLEWKPIRMAVSFLLHLSCMIIRSYKGLSIKLMCSLVSFLFLVWDTVPFCYFYRPQTNLRKGYVFTSVCQEFCPQVGVCQTPPSSGQTRQTPLPLARHTPEQRRLLQRTVRILRECILVGTCNRNKFPWSDPIINSEGDPTEIWSHNWHN